MCLGFEVYAIGEVVSERRPLEKEGRHGLARETGRGGGGGGGGERGKIFDDGSKQCCFDEQVTILL